MLTELNENGNIKKSHYIRRLFFFLHTSRCLLTLIVITMSSRLLHETSHTGSRLNICYILWLSQHKRAHIFNYLKTILSVVIYTIWLSSEIWITCFFLVFFLGGGCFFVFTWFYFLRAVITLSCPPASPCGTLKYCIKKLLPWFLCMSIFCSGLSFNFYICKPFNWNTWAVDCDFTMFFFFFTWYFTWYAGIVILLQVFSHW